MQDDESVDNMQDVSDDIPEDENVDDKQDVLDDIPKNVMVDASNNVSSDNLPNDTSLTPMNDQELGNFTDWENAYASEIDNIRMTQLCLIWKNLLYLNRHTMNLLS